MSTSTNSPHDQSEKSIAVDGLPQHNMLLQNEFTEATLSLSPLLRPVSSLIAELTKTDPEIPAVACIDPVENAVDKMSALVWRVPDRDRQPEDDDPHLARLIHDLAALQPHAIAHVNFKYLTIGMIRQDDHRCDRIAGLPLKPGVFIFCIGK